jgi:hypothetical protein
MGVKVRFWKRAWWLVIHHEGRRKRKSVGDRKTALRMAKAIRERIDLGALNLAPQPKGQTLAAYARV